MARTATREGRPTAPRRKKAARAAAARVGRAAASAKASPKHKRGDAYALRAHILGKAAEVLGKRGAAQTTVGHILDAAGVARRTFYRFFQSKEDVLDALHEIGCNMLIGAATQAANAPGEPIARLMRSIDAYLDFHVSVGAEIMYVVQGESMRAGSKLGPRRRAFFDTMVQLFEQGIHEATGLHVDPWLLRSLLVSLESVSLMFRAESEDGVFELERAKRVMLRIVMATISAPAGGGVPVLPIAPTQP